MDGAAGAGPGAQGAYHWASPVLWPPCLHMPQPLCPTGREVHHFPSNSRHNSFCESAFPAPNNLWGKRFPLVQTFIQVVPPVSPPPLSRYGACNS